MKLRNSIFYKNIVALYKLNLNATNEVHQAVVGAIFNAFVAAHDDIDQAKLQMCLTTATGPWLNIWGDYFNVPREVDEGDEVYRGRILAETIEPKVTLWALKRASATWLNRHHKNNYEPDDIRIFEPWRGLLKPSQRGTLSGDARLWSSDYWTYAVVDIAIPDASELSMELIAYLNEVKAAGVKIIWSVKPSWTLITTGWTDDHVWDNYVSIRQIYARSLYRTFTLFDELPWLGQDDSYYRGNTLSGSIPLSGNQLVWSNMVKRWWNFPIAEHWLRVPLFSQVTTFEDLATIAGVDYDEATLGDLFDFEYEYVEDETWRRIIRASEHGELSTDMSNLWPQGYPGPVENLKRVVSISDKFDLMKYLGPIEINHVNLTQYWVTMASNLRNRATSPIWELIQQSGCLLPTDGLGKFLYHDLSKAYAAWMSFDYILEHLGKTADEVSPEYLVEHQTEAIDAMLWKEAKMDNLLAPIQQKTISLTTFYRTFVNLTRPHSSPIYQLAEQSGCLMPTSLTRTWIYPDFDKTYRNWLSISHTVDLLERSMDDTSFEYLTEHVPSIINALIREEAPYDNILAPFQITSVPV